MYRLDKQKGIMRVGRMHISEKLLRRNDMLTNHYQTARDLIRDGDLIVLRGGKSVLSYATAILLDTPYTHTSLAVWLDQGLYVCEMWREGGPVLVPLSQYEEQPWDVFMCPVNRGKVREQILVHARKEIQYDTRDLIRIWLNKHFGIPLPKAEDASMVCSALSAHLWLDCEWKPKKFLPSIAAPSDVVAALDESPIIEYRPLINRKGE